jgi:hypothetical protein
MSSTLICYDGSPSSSRALEVAHGSLGAGHVLAGRVL